MLPFIHAVLLLICGTALATTRDAKPSQAALLGVVKQALPSELPSDPAASFTCLATWSLPLEEQETLTVSDGCPMADAVWKAANQWRFGFQSRPDSLPNLVVYARFIYGAKEPGASPGWRAELGQGEVSGAPRPMDLAAMKATRRVEPRFPTNGKQVEGFTTRCGAHINVDASGVPTLVITSGCPDDFQVATLASVSQWRFEPVVVDGAAVEATFDMQVTFRLK